MGIAIAPPTSWPTSALVADTVSRSDRSGRSHVVRKPSSAMAVATTNTVLIALVNACAYVARTSGGRWAIAWRLSPAPAALGCDASSAASREAKIAPSTAVPTEPPIDRNSELPDVATPRSR